MKKRETERKGVKKRETERKGVKIERLREERLREEQLREERPEGFALRHKKGKNCQKHMKNTIFNIFFLANCSNLIAICSNHERITHVALLS